MQLYLKSGAPVFVEDAPFASGGEGDLYRVISPGSDVPQVVKLYRPEKRTAERENKLEYLVANPPEFQAGSKHHSVVWIREIVYESGRFAGFTMLMAEGVKLEMLCTQKLPKNIGAEWHRFDFSNPDAMRLRLGLCFNIAAAVYQVHAAGHYVLVDMKPENIIIQANGLISLIDIDSVEVINDNRVLFPARVATPEFTPPEYYKGVRPENHVIEESWDRFSMAVIFYKLLFGIHPFTGNNHRPPYNNCQTLSDMIEHGLFPFGSRSGYLGTVPPPHQKFKQVEKELQELFLRCFEAGHTEPYMRPSADEWCSLMLLRSPVAINRPQPSVAVRLPNPVYSDSPIVPLSLPELPEAKEYKLPPMDKEKYSHQQVFTGRQTLAAVIAFILWVIIAFEIGILPGVIMLLVAPALIVGFMYLNYTDNRGERTLKELKGMLARQSRQFREVVELKTKLLEVAHLEVDNPLLKQHISMLDLEKARIDEVYHKFNAFMTDIDAAYRELCRQEEEEGTKIKQVLKEQMAVLQTDLGKAYMTDSPGQHNTLIAKQYELRQQVENDFGRIKRRYDELHGKLIETAEAEKLQALDQYRQINRHTSVALQTISDETEISKLQEKYRHSADTKQQLVAELVEETTRLSQFNYRIAELKTEADRFSEMTIVGYVKQVLGRS